MKKYIEVLILGWLLAGSGVVALLLNLGITGSQKYEFLARAFVRGKIYFIDELHDDLDVVTYRTRTYWPLGLLPAALMTPLEAGSRLEHTQGYLQIWLTLGTGFWVYWLARKSGLGKQDSWWMVAAFCLGSIFQQAMLLPTDLFVAHSAGVFFCLWGVVMTLEKKWFLAGVGFGLAALARELMVVGVGFGLVMAWESFGEWGGWTKRAVRLLVPVATAVGIILIYNYVRFGEVRPTKQHELANLGFVDAGERQRLFKNGILNMKYIPGNFYYYFVRTLDLVEEKEGKFVTEAKWPYIKLGYPGVSFFVASPVFIYIFGLKKLRKKTWSAIAVVVPMVIVLLMYYWPGWNQTGPRFLLDAFPFIYLILVERFRGEKLPLPAKGLILGSSGLNLYLFLQAWGIR